jgi:GHMP kinases N terminal domain
MGALFSVPLSIPNFSARVNGDLPAECGLASSAALEVATALFLLKLSRAEQSKFRIPQEISAKNRAATWSRRLAFLHKNLIIRRYVHLVALSRSQHLAIEID